MHELSIAQSLIDGVTERLIESGADRVTRVIVEVGELSGVVPAALQTAFRIATANEPGLRGATLEVVPVAVTLQCETCGERPAERVQSLRCAACGRPSACVVRGRELNLLSIEVIDAAADA